MSLLKAEGSNLFDAIVRLDVSVNACKSNRCSLVVARITVIVRRW